MFLFLNPCLPEFSYPKNPQNLRPYSSNSTKNVTHYSQFSCECDPIQRHIPSSLLLGSTPPEYATLSHARFEEKDRHKRIKKRLSVTVVRMKFLLNFQTQKTTQERINVESFLLSARLQVRQRTFTPA